MSYSSGLSLRGRRAGATREARESTAIPLSRCHSTEGRSWIIGCCYSDSGEKFFDLEVNPRSKKRIGVTLQREEHGLRFCCTVKD